jgi:hypothetical protein
VARFRAVGGAAEGDNKYGLCFLSNFCGMDIGSSMRPKKLVAPLSYHMFPFGKRCQMLVGDISDTLRAEDVSVQQVLMRFAAMCTIEEVTVMP